MRTIRMTAGLVALGVVLVTQTAEMQDKPFVRVTKEQGMAALKTAADAAKGNYASLESNFQKEIRKIWNDYDNVTYKVYERVEMVVLVMGPCELMLSQASSTTKPSRSRYRRTTSLTVGSSSTTSTRCPIVRA